MEPIIKPGWKTSEFWLTILGITLSAAVIIGAITQEESDTLAAALEVLAGMLATMGITSNYIKGRSIIKAKQ